MIRKATENDLAKILSIYDGARTFMRQNGNPTQWSGGYPNSEVLLDDIDKGQLYVVEESEILGVFMFTLEPEPTYKIIEKGNWKDSSPYGTIHRIASAGIKGGVLKEAIDFCEEKCRHLRIDTHADNTVMQNLLVKNGFSYCGIIYLANGDERLAYEKI